MTTREALIVTQQVRVLQAGLQQAKTEAATLRIENSLLREAGQIVLLGLLARRRNTCLLCGARMYERDMQSGHRALCPARPLANVLADKL